MDYAELNELQTVFRTAIEKEREVQRIYAEAAQRATKRTVKKLFATLLHDEVLHEKKLEKEFLVLREAFA